MRVAAYVTPKQFRANSLYCIYVAIKCIIVLHFKKKTSPFLFFFLLKSISQNILMGFLGLDFRYLIYQDYMIKTSI